MTKKEIRSLAKTKALEGKTHQEIFDEIMQDAPMPIEQVGDIVKNVATLKKREQFKILNGLFIAYLGFIVILYLFALVSGGNGSAFNFYAIAFCVVMGIALWGAVNYDVLSYRSAAIFAGISLTKTIGPDLSLDRIISFVLLVLLLALALVLYYCLRGKYEIEKEKHYDEEGQMKLRKVLYFLPKPMNV